MLVTLTLSVLTHVIIACAASTPLEIRERCEQGYALCDPDGALSSAEPPPVGPRIADLLVDLVFSVDETEISDENTLDGEETMFPRGLRGTDLCCPFGASCLLLKDSRMPFCYDQFSTNYELPGGATGTLISGQYVAANGDRANLIYGSYILNDGTAGNIYEGLESRRVDTATIPLPTKFLFPRTSALIDNRARPTPGGEPVLGRPTSII